MKSGNSKNEGGPAGIWGIAGLLSQNWSALAPQGTDSTDSRWPGEISAGQSPVLRSFFSMSPKNVYRFAVNLGGLAKPDPCSHVNSEGRRKPVSEEDEGRSACICLCFLAPRKKLETRRLCFVGRISGFLKWKYVSVELNIMVKNKITLSFRKLQQR